MESHVVPFGRFFSVGDVRLGVNWKGEVTAETDAKVMQIALARSPAVGFTRIGGVSLRLAAVHRTSKTVVLQVRRKGAWGRGRKLPRRACKLHHCRREAGLAARAAEVVLQRFEKEAESTATR